MYLNTKDIEGASPKRIGMIKGKKRVDFFRENPELNNFYNKKTVG